MGRYVLFVVSEEDLLHVWMAKYDRRPADYESNESPRNEVGADKEKTGDDEEKEEDSGRERLVGEIRRRRDGSEKSVMYCAKVVHAVLQVSHIPEEVLRHLSSGFDRTRRCKWRTVNEVETVVGCRRRWMTDEVGWYEDEEEDADDGNSRDEIGVQTDECKDSQEGEGV